MESLSIQNRNESYKQIFPTLPQCERDYLNALIQMKTATDNEMNRMYKFEKSWINARRNALQKKGLVREVGNRKDSISGKNNTVYQAVTKDQFPERFI